MNLKNAILFMLSVVILTSCLGEHEPTLIEEMTAWGYTFLLFKGACWLARKW